MTRTVLGSGIGLLFIALVSGAACGTATESRLSVAGESCGRTADCEAAARCVAQRCVRAGEVDVGAEVEDPTKIEPALIDDDPTKMSAEELAKGIVAALRTGNREAVLDLAVTQDGIDINVAKLSEKQGRSMRLHWEAEGLSPERYTKRLDTMMAQHDLAFEEFRYFAVVGFNAVPLGGGVEVTNGLLKIALMPRTKKTSLVLSVEAILTSKGWKVLRYPAVTIDERREVVMTASGHVETGRPGDESYPYWGNSSYPYPSNSSYSTGSAFPYPSGPYPSAYPSSFGSTRPYGSSRPAGSANPRPRPIP